MSIQRKYKQTDIGVIPSDWEIKKIEEIAEVDPENLGSNTRPEYAFKYISLENVDNGTLRSYSEQIFRTAPSRARRKIRKGDVLVSTVRPNLKSHLLVRDAVIDTICSTGFSVVRCKTSLAEPAFVFYHLFTGNIGQQIESLLTGSNYPSINRRDVKALLIPCPPYIEQTIIANVFLDIDALIDGLKSLITKKEAIKQGAMQELLTGKRRLSGFSGKWVSKMLGKVAGKIVTGKLDANAMVENGEYRFYTCAKDYYFIDRFAFDTEALLVSGNGANVGYIHYYKGRFNAYQRTYVLFDFSEDIIFIKLFMDRNLQERIRVEVNAGNTPYITMGTLSEMSIMFPPTIEEQAAIVAILCDMDTEIKALEQKLVKYQFLKQGMMQTLVKLG